MTQPRRKPASSAKKPAAKKRGMQRAGGGVQSRRGRTVDAAAKNAGARAAAAGAAGPQNRSGPGAAARRALRDKAILAGHRAGRSTAEIAAEWKLSQRAVQDVIKASRERRSPIEEAPMDLVEGALREYLELMDTWAALAASALDADQWPAAVGALKGYAETFEKYMGTLTELGKLPENLELFRMQSELERLGQLVLDSVDEFAEGRLNVEQVRARVHELVDRPQLPTIEAKARTVKR